MKKTSTLLLSMVLILQSALVSAEPVFIDRIVALVDSDVVLASELIRRSESIIKQIKERKQKVPPMIQLKKQILDRLIIESLQLQMAKRIGVRISDAELDNTIDKMSQENKMSKEAFRKTVVAEGMEWATFREDIRRDIMISRARSAYVSRQIKISEKEVDNLIDQINIEGQSRMQYSLGHILLTIAEGSSHEEINKVRAQAEKLVSGLRGGASFEEYAIAYSAGENALSGGNLGWRSLSQLPTLFADNVKNMKDKDVSEPLRSGSGLHILYLKESKGGFEAKSVIQTHARHILISPNAIMDEKAAFDKIDLLRQRIIAGEKFDTLAIEFSDDKGSGSLGGDLDWTDPGTFVPEFNQTMDKLAKNELSKPVKSQFGWHIIEVLGRRSKDQTEDIKRDKAYRILHNRKFEEEAQIWLREIKDQAYIKIIDDD